MHFKTTVVFLLYILKDSYEILQLDITPCFFGPKLIFVQNFSFKKLFFVKEPHVWVNLSNNIPRKYILTFIGIIEDLYLFESQAKFISLFENQIRYAWFLFLKNVSARNDLYLNIRVVSSHWIIFPGALGCIGVKNFLLFYYFIY